MIALMTNVWLVALLSFVNSPWLSPYHDQRSRWNCFGVSSGNWAGHHVVIVALPIGRANAESRPAKTGMPASDYADELEADNAMPRAVANAAPNVQMICWRIRPCSLQQTAGRWHANCPARRWASRRLHRLQEKSLPDLDPNPCRVRSIDGKCSAMLGMLLSAKIA